MGLEPTLILLPANQEEGLVPVTRLADRTDDPIGPIARRREEAHGVSMRGNRAASGKHLSTVHPADSERECRMRWGWLWGGGVGVVDYHPPKKTQAANDSNVTNI